MPLPPAAQDPGVKYHHRVRKTRLMRDWAGFDFFWRCSIVAVSLMRSALICERRMNARSLPSHHEVGSKSGDPEMHEVQACIKTNILPERCAGHRAPAVQCRSCRHLSCPHVGCPDGPSGSDMLYTCI